MARPIKSKALERLRRALDAIPELKNLRYGGSPEFKKWQRNTEVAITNTFGNKSDYITDFDRIRFSLTLFETSESERQQFYVKSLELAAAVLESMIEEIEEYWEDENQTPTPIPSETHENEQINTDKVFIVHGRDGDAKNTVARFLERLGLKPIILAEMPGQGQTIIEKFEQHAQVGFAIVLLTPDDAGSLRGDGGNFSLRARQNVIFELGFFIGRLGRERVRALIKGEVEIPSDYTGIEYISLNDSDDWKLKLIRELKSVGFEVDANRAIQT